MNAALTLIVVQNSLRGDGFLSLACSSGRETVVFEARSSASYTALTTGLAGCFTCQTGGVMAREIKLTKAGYERLKQELQEEKQRLDEATRVLQEQMESYEDYEDSGLEESKREKARIEARVDSLEDILQRAVIIESAEGDKIALGSIVLLKDEKTKENLTIQIVAPAEATILEDPMRVSDESPLGAALLGKKEGDKVRIETPSGKRRYAVLSVGA